MDSVVAVDIVGDEVKVPVDIVKAPPSGGVFQDGPRIQRVCVFDFIAHDSPVRGVDKKRIRSELRIAMPPGIENIAALDKQIPSALDPIPPFEAIQEPPAVSFVLNIVEVFHNGMLENRIKHP
jgi:hypothetical protein